MEQCILRLQAENRSLRGTISSLKNKCRDHEVKFITMRHEVELLKDSLINKKRRQIEPKESAVLVPQQQVMVLCLLLLLSVPLFSVPRQELRRLPFPMMITVTFSQTAPWLTSPLKLQSRYRRPPEKQMMRLK